MATFSDQERAFFTAPNIVHLATVGADGGPNVSAVWVDLDGDDVLINTAEGRAKADDVKRDPKVAVSVVNPENPYEQVYIRGEVVEVTTDARGTTSTRWPRSTWARTSTRSPRRARCACWSGSAPPRSSP